MTSCHPMHSCNVTKLTAQARYPPNGRLPVSPPFSNTEMPQTLPTTDQLQLGSHYAGNHRLTQYTEQQQLRTHTHTHTHKLNTDLISALLTKHLCCSMSLINKKHAHKPLYLCFQDLKAAYDRVQWPLIWQVFGILQHLGIHGNMLIAIHTLCSDCSLAMKCPHVRWRQSGPQPI